MDIKKYGKTFPKNNLALMMFMDGRGQEFIWANFWIFNGEFKFFCLSQIHEKRTFSLANNFKLSFYDDKNLYNKFLLALYGLTRYIAQFLCRFSSTCRETFPSQIKPDALRNLV